MHPYDVKKPKITITKRVIAKDTSNEKCSPPHKKKRKVNSIQSLTIKELFSKSAKNIS